MPGERSGLKGVDPNNIYNVKRERKQKHASLAPTYELEKEDGEVTDEEFRPTGADEDDTSNVASDEEDSPQPAGRRTRSRNAGGCSQARDKQAHDRSPDTASTTSTPPGSDRDGEPGSQHVEQSDPTADGAAPSLGAGSPSQQHPTQPDGVHTGQESAPPLTQLEGVVFSEAQLPSPVPSQHVRADGASQPELEDNVDEPQRQPPHTPERTSGRASSQQPPGLPSRSPQLAGEQQLPQAAPAQQPPDAGIESKSPHNAANTSSGSQRLTRAAAAQQQSGKPSKPSPGRPMNRSGASTATKSADKVTQRFKSKARDQASTAHKGAAGPASGGPGQAGTSEAAQRSPERDAGTDDLTESQLRHIAHPAAKPAHAGKDRPPAQPQRYQACIPFAESEGEEPAARDAVGSQPSGGDDDAGAGPQAAGDAHPQPATTTSEAQNSQGGPVAAETFLANVAARVEKLRLWLRYGSGCVRVVAEAVVDVSVPEEGRVYRHRGAPVLLKWSDAETSAQVEATAVHGCLEREGALFLLHCEEDGSSCGGGRRKQLQGELHGDRRHVVPVIMIQACEPGVPQAGDTVVPSVEERLQQGGAHAADSFANLRWIDDDVDSYFEWLSRCSSEELVPWGPGQDQQAAAGAAGPSTSRGVLQEVPPARLGRMRNADTDAVVARNTDTPDRKGTKQSGSVVWGSPMKPPLQHCLSREPSAPVLQAPPAARANMHGKPGVQQGRAGGKRVRQQGGSPVDGLVSAAGQAPSPTEKKRAKSDLDAIFSSYSNLAALKKPEHAESLKTITEMWYGSAAMQEYGKLSVFTLAYAFTGYPIELFRLREPLGSSSELGNGM